MSRLIDDAQQGQFNVVVVHSLDRWARSMCLSVDALQRLTDADVRFVSVAENMDSGTESGRFMMKMMGRFAEFFSDQVRRHSRRSFEGGHQA